SILHPNQFTAKLVRLDVRTAEAVNRLFRVANEKQRARPQLTLLPRPLLIGHCRDREENLALDPIGILKFVDQDEPILLPNGNAHIVVTAHEIADVKQEIVKIKDGGSALARMIAS